MMKKRYLFLLAFMAVMFLCLPASLHAAENSKHPDDGVYKAIHVDPEDYSGYDLQASATEGDSSDFSADDGLKIFSDDTTTGDTGLYRTQMTGLMADIYDGIASVSINSTNNAVTVTHYYQNGESTDSVWNAYKAVYSQAMWGYMRDHQDQFLWSINALHIGGNASSSKIILTFTFPVSGFYSDSLGTEAQAKISSVVSGCTASTRETKIKYYHDWITANNSYDTARASITEDDNTAEFYYAHSAIGCLIKGTGVCESYAKAFKIFCLRENIPCLIVSSASHAWNYVKMEDGNWYMVDCTWDDPVGGTENYNYYLISNTPNIDTSHTVDSYFTYPDTATTKYGHNYTLSTTVPSTCTVAGYKLYRCSHCDDTYTEALPLDPENHSGQSTTLINKKEATCVEAGYTGDTICGGCNAVVTKGTIISATGIHQYDDGIITKQATCCSTGEKTFTCSICKSVKTESIPIDKDNHQSETEIMNQKEATCIETGYTGDTICTGCNAVLEESTVVPIDKDNHQSETKIMNQKEATCTETGYTGDTVCTGCNAVIAKGSTIPIDKDNHQSETEIINQKDTFCGNDGYTGDTICTGCKAILEKGTIIPATSKHNYGNWTTTKASTVFVTGLRTRKCTVCGASQQQTIAKLTPTIKLSKTSLTLKKKKKYQLKITMAKGDSVKSWKSSNKKIAVISSKGIITAKKKGKATITVTLKSGKKAICKVKVKK